MRLVSIAVLAAACGKGGGSSASDCPVRDVRIDGTPVALDHVLGVRTRGGYLMEAYSHREATCEEATAPVATPRAGEVIGRAGSFPEHGMVGLGDSSHIVEVRTRLVREPEKVGGLVAVCVPEPVEYTPGAGEYQGKRIRVVGLFEGTFCGDTR